MRTNGWKIGLVVLGLLIGSGRIAVAGEAEEAGTIDDEFPGLVVREPGTGLSYGWRFVADADISVTDLGLLDWGRDGLGDSHAMGLWHVSGDGFDLKGSVVVDNAQGTPGADGYYLYVPLDNAISLTQGEVYLLGAYSSLTSVDPTIIRPNTDEAGNSSVNVSAPITITGYKWEYSSTLVPPWAGGGAESLDNYGVNFRFEPANETPVVQEVTIPPAAVGHEVLLGATFSDADVDDTHTMTIDWGDGTAPTEVPAAEISYSTVDGVLVGTVSVGHTYTEASGEDAYAVVVTVTDADATSDPVTAYAAVHEPTDGFAVGAGWFADESLPRGKAFFGFVCRTVWWSDSPQGRLRFRAGDLRFRSTQYDWLSIAEGDDRAIFAGLGTINGAGEYYFIVEVAADPDDIWITIFGDDGYDNEPGSDLSGGRIRIRTCSH